MSSQKHLNVKQAVPFFWVKEIEASVNYYVDGLGCQLTEKWVDDGKLKWCWLNLGATAIMLQEFWKQGDHTNIPNGKLGEGVSICFICDDALSFYNEITSRGIEASEPFVGNRMWVTELTDPDGYKLFFESSTAVPEETRYSEWRNQTIDQNL